MLLDWPIDAAAPPPPSHARVEGERWCLFEGRCDNRSALAREAGLSHDAPVETVLLHLWRAQCERGLSAIEGEFALMLFDGKRLVLARDAFGTRPLHYAHGATGLQVAHGPLALARASGRVRADPVRLASFVLNLSEEGSRSFFAGIETVPPGHFVTFTAAGPGRCEPWWRPDFDPFTGTQADAIALMEDLLVRSVEGLLAHAQRPALELSAGIDSTLLLGLAAPRSDALLAISGGPTEPFDPIPGNIVDETTLAKEAAAALGVPFAAVHAPPTGVIDGIKRFALFERPTSNPSNWGWMDAVHARAQAHGADVLVQGPLGNFTTSWTGEYGLSQAIAQRDPRSAAIELGAIARMPWRRAGSILKNTLRDRLPGWLVRAAIERSFVELSAMRHVNPDHEAIAPLIEREASHRHLPGRWEHRAADPAERLRRWILNTDMGLHNRAIERRYGFVPRDAFADRALVEASLRMPAHLFRDAKGERAIARRLLDPRLPQAIRDGGPPAVQGAGWRHGLLKEREALLELIEWARGDAPMRGLFSLGTIHKRLKSIPAQPVRTMSDYMAYRFDLAPALTALAFARWIEQDAA